MDSAEKPRFDPQPINYWSEPIDAPRYDLAFDWLTATEGRAFSLDIWARGNYTRRLIHHHQSGAQPLIVPVKSVEQMRWAYRRLALLGLPVDFVYTGRLPKPAKVLQLRPADRGQMDDGCWGYIGGAPGEFGGRKWIAMIGYSQAMPDPLVDWLVNEASSAFVRGDVFLAPAELIGIDPTQNNPGSEALAALAEGRLVRNGESAAALMNLDLPAVDLMLPENFQKFLDESEDDLAQFRSAFRRLAHEDVRQSKDLVREIQAEVAAMHTSRRYTRMRRNVTLLGGALATTTASVTASIGAAAPGAALPAVASAAGAAAAACLVDLVKQRADRLQGAGQNSFQLLWKLGMDRVGKVRESPGPTVRLGTTKFRADVVSTEHPETHWLCPPTASLTWLVVKRDDTHATAGRSQIQNVSTEQQL
jgi:hypothetical protein